MVSKTSESLTKDPKHREEVIAMTYKAPQLTVIQSAMVAIQGGKDNVTMTDTQHERSVPAYQADE